MTFTSTGHPEQHHHHHLGQPPSPGCPVRHGRVRDEVVRAGVAAWHRLKQCKTFDDWLALGEALLIGRAKSMRAAHSNVPNGTPYKNEIAAWLKANDLTDMHKTVRSRLLDVMAHRAEIERWRTNYNKLRLELNHPAVILRRWQKTQTPKPDDASKRPSPYAKLEAANVELQNELHKAKHEIERGGGDLWADLDTAKDIAKIVADKVMLKFGPSKVEAVGKELMRLAREGRKPDRRAIAAEAPACTSRRRLQVGR